MDDSVVWLSRFMLLNKDNILKCILDVFFLRMGYELSHIWWQQWDLSGTDPCSHRTYLRRTYSDRSE